MFSIRCQALVRTMLAKYNSQRKTEAKFLATGFCTRASGTNYYEALGIPKNSTQADIKAAYYKLSMQFHPDKNRGSEVAAKKFREITQAYEVLGNYRLRRLYDKGAIHSAGPQFARAAECADDYRDEVPDDPETKFYKSRFKKSTVVDSTGRTPIYNFDEWSRAHYGQSFQRRKDAKHKWDRQQSRNHSHAMSTQNEIVIFAFIFGAVVMYLLFVTEPSYDTPKEIAQREAAEVAQKQNKSS